MKITTVETVAALTDRLLAERRAGPFHLSDGAYFWREVDGVHLAIADTVTGVIVHHFVFDKSSWASAFACTTWEGETGTTFRVADALLG